MSENIKKMNCLETNNTLLKQQRDNVIVQRDIAIEKNEYYEKALEDLLRYSFSMVITEGISYNIESILENGKKINEKII